MNPMEKEKRLEALAEEIGKCRKCRLWKEARNAVAGEGPADASVMLVGQNPGEKEDLTGKPFVGTAGKYLDKVLEKNGIKREGLYITSVVKHHSPNNRKPKPDEIAACLPWLLKQIELLDPKLVVLMGKVAGEVPRSGKREYVETVHPAAAMRFPKQAQKFEECFKHLGKRKEVV